MALHEEGTTGNIKYVFDFLDNDFVGEEPYLCCTVEKEGKKQEAFIKFDILSSDSVDVDYDYQERGHDDYCYYEGGYIINDLKYVGKKPSLEALEGEELIGLTETEKEELIRVGTEIFERCLFEKCIDDYDFVEELI